MSLSGFYGPSSEAEASGCSPPRWISASISSTPPTPMAWARARAGSAGSSLRTARGAAKVTLATKFSITRNAEGKRFIDNSQAHMIAALDASLKRLGVDHVDLYYVHRLDPRFPIEETVGALARQVEAGKIGAIGLSEMAPDTLRRACAVHPIAAMQSEYSLWTRAPELGMLQACRELGVAFVAFSPVARGALSGRVRDIEALAPAISAAATRAFTGLNWQRNLARIDAYRRAGQNFRPRALRTGDRLGAGAGPHVLAIPGTRYPENLAADVARRRKAADARPRPRRWRGCCRRLGGGRSLHRRAMEQYRALLLNFTACRCVRSGRRPRSRHDGPISQISWPRSPRKTAPPSLRSTAPPRRNSMASSPVSSPAAKRARRCRRPM